MPNELPGSREPAIRVAIRGHPARRARADGDLHWRSQSCGRGRGDRRAVLAVRHRTVGALPEPNSARCRRESSTADLNLLVITLDTTRADGSGLTASATLGRLPSTALARDGVLFDARDEHAPLTLPAHASLFTGRFPPQHGVRDNGGFFLDDNEETLAESAAARRVRDRRVSSPRTCSTRSGASTRGFDTYVDDFDLSKYTRDLARRDSASRQRGGGSARCEWLEGPGTPTRRVSSPGCTSTIRTRPTSRRNRSRAVSRPSLSRGNRVRRRAGRPLVAVPATSATCSIAPSSSSSAITARAWATTAKRRTASSSTRASSTCR